MRAVDLRGSSATDAHGLLIKKFFRALGKGDFAAAGKLVSDPVDLFGTSVEAAHFATGNDTSLGRVVERVEELPLDILSAAEQHALLGGTVAPSARVYFATVAHGDERVTYGLVIDARTVVLRLFDPMPFKRFAADLARGEHDHP